MFGLEKNESKSITTLRIEIIAVFVFFSSLGFPGTYCRIFGNFLDILVGYGSFFLQIAIMLLMSGDSFLEIRVIDLKEKYVPIYQYLVIVFIDSMLFTSSRSDQIITCLRLSTTILFAIWLTEHIGLERIIELYCFAQILIDVAVVGMIVLRPGLAFHSESTFSHALRGIFDAKNTMGAELSFGAIIIYLNISNKQRHRTKRLKWIFFLVIHMGFLVLTKATGALLLSMGIIGFQMFFGEDPKYRVSLGWWYIGISVGFLFFAFTILPLFEPILHAIGKDATLTGRTILWDGIYKFVQEQNILTGFGYGHFWLDRRAVAKLHMFFDRNSFFGNMNTGAHNQIFELWLNTGLIGLGSYFAVILLCMRRIKFADMKTYRTVSSIMMYLTVCGLTERIFAEAYSYRVLVFFIVMAAGIKDEIRLPVKKDDGDEELTDGAESAADPDAAVY